MISFHQRDLSQDVFTMEREEDGLNICSIFQPHFNASYLFV